MWTAANFIIEGRMRPYCGRLCTVALDRNPIFYSFSRLIAIVANTYAHIYAREEQILAIRMIVLEE